MNILFFNHLEHKFMEIVQTYEYFYSIPWYMGKYIIVNLNNKIKIFMSLMVLSILSIEMTSDADILGDSSCIPLFPLF